MRGTTRLLLIAVVCCALFASPTIAFGAGNIASLSKIEGKNWRHGDIEDMLKTVASLKGHKWTSLMIKRVYFGNWLRDYSQAVDVGTLKGVQSGAIRILVWVLSFLSFGYATGEFEVTDERLGVYRPEEHIDNPEGYADNDDARQYDPRLRPPVRQEELDIDPTTGMKNYIANERGDWATSAGYIRFSFARSIHFGRVYTSSPPGQKGQEADLFEALRCLGQGLHCLEDFGAHTNYVELSLRELGYRNVFPHVGEATEMAIGNKNAFPLVTGTFGGVDFLHSVLGEATDHVTQSEVDDMHKSLDAAASAETRRDISFREQPSDFPDLLSRVPGCGDLGGEAMDLQSASHTRAAANNQAGFPVPPNSASNMMQSSDGTQINLEETATKVYRILEFRDKLVKKLAIIVEKIPGLESLIDKISEKITLFIMSLLAPYVVPIINTVSSKLKVGSSTVVDASGKHQYEPWTNPICTAPTHSLLSKDHFSNILNEPAGLVASAILQYAAPRVIFAMENPQVPVEQVLDDVVKVFHHPCLRQPDMEIHQAMFNVVQKWANSYTGEDLNSILSSDSVKQGRNHIGVDPGGSATMQSIPSQSSGIGSNFLGLLSGNSSVPGRGLFGSRAVPDQGQEHDASQSAASTFPPATLHPLDSTSHHDIQSGLPFGYQPQTGFQAEHYTMNWGHPETLPNQSYHDRYQYPKGQSQAFPVTYNYGDYQGSSGDWQERRW